MVTQTAVTRRGPRSRVERMHFHVNKLRTGPCSRGRHWYVPMRDDMRCERCDEPAPRFEKRWERCRVFPTHDDWMRALTHPAELPGPPQPEPPPAGASTYMRTPRPVTVVGIDPANPHAVTTATVHDDGTWQAEATWPPTPFKPYDLSDLDPLGWLRKPRPTLQETRAAIRRALADARLRPDEFEPADLTAPVKHILVQPGTFPPLFPAVDIHPNGGIPG